MHLCNNWSLGKWISYFYILRRKVWCTLVLLDSLFQSTASEPRNLFFVIILGWSVRVGLREQWYLQDIDSFLMQIVFFVRNPWKKVWYEFISSPLASWCLMLQKQHFKINLLYLSYFTIWLIIVQDWVVVVV